MTKCLENKGKANKPSAHQVQAAPAASAMVFKREAREARARWSSGSEWRHQSDKGKPKWLNTAPSVKCLNDHPMADDMMKTPACGHGEAENIEDHGGKLLAEISILFQHLTGGCEERHEGQLLRELPPFSIRLPLLW